MKKNLTIMSAIVFCLVVLGSGIGTAHADMAAISITGGTTADTNFTGPLGVTDGWQFSLDEAITVTQLGYYDYDADGLAEDHEVGIFTDAGALLFSDTVTTADSLDADGFRYTDIAAAVLGAGTYRIGAFRATSTDKMLRSATVVSASPVTYITGYVVGDVAALTFPDHHPAGGFQPGFFGPNFQFQPVPIPGAFLLGLLGLGVASRRLRRRKTA